VLSERARGARELLGVKDRGEPGADVLRLVQVLGPYLDLDRARGASQRLLEEVSDQGVGRHLRARRLELW
jgi:hypothetical protein